MEEDNKTQIPPVVWTIAGSDSCGGAGIQTDLKVMNAFDVYGCSIITALTAQNTQGVQYSEPVSETMLNEQLKALDDDLPPVAIKTGMLGSANSCAIVADFLTSHLTPKSSRPLLICDPVLKSTSGTDLLDPDALDILIHTLFPKVDVLTPNLPEVEKLLGQPIQSVEKAAKYILEWGVKSVLIKGGHAEGSVCTDYWTDGNRELWLSSPRIETTGTHGTGCILSSAIASSLALGQEIPDAVITAKTFLNQCLKRPTNLGMGLGPMEIKPFMNDRQDQPMLTTEKP